MEFIDGETLRERLSGAPMKLSEVLDVAIQTSSAFSAAHAAGIVHRDLKPENIMLRRDGIVKVLDFGLAKLTEQLPPDSIDREAPTRALVKTEPGVVMGTAIYMSPEQARGLPVDGRTDIFSVGVVLYEMVAGRRPFDGPTATDVLTAILEREPLPLKSSCRDIPAGLADIIEKCLEKDPSHRYAKASDLVSDLRSVRHGDSRRHTGIGFMRRHLRSLAVSAVVVLAAIAAVIWVRPGPPVLTDRDSIVLADFVNTTGDPAFDQTLKEALAIQLEQSPYLNIVPEDRIRETLRYMGRSPDERITHDVA